MSIQAYILLTMVLPAVVVVAWTIWEDIKLARYVDSISYHPTEVDSE